MKIILELKDVTKKFGDFIAVNNVSFKISKGDRIGIIGANGAGKTTITEIIAGISKPTSGEIKYGYKYEDSPKEGIGMQFQQSEYPSGLSVKDIVNFARNLRKLSMTNDEVKKLLAIFKMEDFYNKQVRSLSGGQKQKLNILLSIIHSPHIVILDELSTGLDISARHDIINFTDKLLKERDMTAIIISHHMSEIKALCSKVITMDRGRLIETREIKDIEKEYGSLDKYARTLIEKGNVESKRASSKGIDIQSDKYQDKKSSKSKSSKNNKKEVK